MLNKYENSLDTSDCLGNTQQDKILEQEKDTVTPTEHEEIYENDVTPPTGNHIINTVADLLLQPNAVTLLPSTLLRVGTAFGCTLPFHSGKAPMKASSLGISANTSSGM